MAARASFRRALTGPRSAAAQRRRGIVLRRHVGGRRLGAGLGLVVAAALVMTPPALAGTFTPESGGSPNADHIDGLYKLTLAFALIIFVGVESALLYSLLKFRARKGRVAAQIRGNTRLEIGWTLGAAAVLIVLAAATFVTLASIRTPVNSDAKGLKVKGAVQYAGVDKPLPPNGKSLNVSVNGQQYVWRYTYPGGKNPNGLDNPYSYEEMVVPTNTTITLDIVAQDVAHSWWIPKLGGKQDAIPGYTNHTWFKISKPGLYTGQCAELCGRGHARMIATVRAVPPAQFEAWLMRRKRDIAAANQAAQASRQKLSSRSGPQSIQSP